LSEVLFVPGIGTNLLSTQALLAHGIENHQLIMGVDFYHKGEIAARGSHEGKTSYLTWVQDENALLNETARRISENSDDRRPKKKRVDAELAHRRLGHPGNRRLILVQKSARDIEIRGEPPTDCNICTRAKKTRVQNHE
jgi:hypothetical protein